MKKITKKAAGFAILGILCVSFAVILTVRSTTPAPEYETRWFTAQEWDEYQALSEKQQNAMMDITSFKQLAEKRDSLLEKQDQTEEDKLYIEAYNKQLSEDEKEFERKYGASIDSDICDRLSEELNAMGTTNRVEGVEYVTGLKSEKS